MSPQSYRPSRTRVPRPCSFAIVALADACFCLAAFYGAAVHAQPQTWDHVTVWADAYLHDPYLDGEVIESYDVNGNPILLPDDAGRLERALAATNGTGCLGISGKFYVSRTIDITGRCILGVRHWRNVGFELIAAQGNDPGDPVWGPSDALIYGYELYKLEGANLYGEQMAGYGAYFEEDSGPVEIEIRNVSAQGTTVAAIHMTENQGVFFEKVHTNDNQGDGIVLDRVAGVRFEAVSANYNMGTGMKIEGDYTAMPALPVEIFLRYPKVEQNDGHGIWIKDRTQPVFVRGGWFEGQSGHGVLIDNSENVDVRYAHVSGSRDPLASGFDPAAVTLHGDSRNNTVEDNYFSNHEEAGLGWYTDLSGNTVTTDLASNTVQNNWEVNTQFQSSIFSPATYTLDPAYPDAFDSSPYCGDGTVDAGEACDDGNRNNEDGCDEVCEIELCGDGIRQNSATVWEECDLGAGNGPGANCSATCEDLTVVGSPPPPTVTSHHGEVLLSSFTGYADDTAMLNAALSASGKYNCLVGSGTLTLNATIGVGWRCIKGTDLANPLELVADPNASWAPGQTLLESGADAFILENVSVDANNVVDFGLHSYRSHSAWIRNTRFQHALLAGVYLELTNVIVLRNVTTRDNVGDGAWLESMNGSITDELRAINNGGSGLRVFAGGPKPPFEKDPCAKPMSGGLYLGRAVARDNGRYGIEIVGTSSPVIVDGATIEGNRMHGVHLFGARQPVIVDSLISGGDSTDSFSDYALFLDHKTWGATVRDNEVVLEDALATGFPILGLGEYPDSGVSLLPLPSSWQEISGNLYAGAPLLVDDTLPTCPTVTSPPTIYLFDTLAAPDGDMDGRPGADALALAGVPAGLFAGGFTAHALLAGEGIGLQNLPARMCFDDSVPVLGIDSSGTVMGTLASDWADLMDGTIPMTIATALSATPDTDSFWTGSDVLGDFTNADCCGWESDVAGVDDAAISNQMNTTVDWLADPVAVGVCDASHRLLGVAYATP